MVSAGGAGQGVGGGGDRESPYLPRRDKTPWDLDKRETGGQGARGRAARCQEGRENRQLQERSFKKFYLKGG